MANINIQLVKAAPTNLPPGVTFGQTTLVVTDAASATQTISLNGTESPPWFVTVSSLADGTGTIVATDLDTNGNTLAGPISQSFTTTQATFSATTGITVTPA